MPPDPNEFDGTTHGHLRGDMLTLSSLKFVALNPDRLGHTIFVTTLLSESHAVFLEGREKMKGGLVIRPWSFKSR